MLVRSTLGKPAFSTWENSLSRIDDTNQISHRHTGLGSLRLPDRGISKVLEARAVRSSGAIVAVTVGFPLRARETCGDKPAEGVGPHRTCRERDSAVGEPVAERGNGVEGVVAELVFADGDVEELLRNVSEIVINLYW